LGNWKWVNGYSYAGKSGLSSEISYVNDRINASSSLSMTSLSRWGWNASISYVPHEFLTVGLSGAVVSKYLALVHVVSLLDLKILQLSFGFGKSFIANQPIIDVGLNLYLDQSTVFNCAWGRHPEGMEKADCVSAGFLMKVGEADVNVAVDSMGFIKSQVSADVLSDVRVTASAALALRGLSCSVGLNVEMLK
jgi:hypothetical protein